MDRKEFLKSACGLGVCGCALSLLGAPEPLHAGDTAAPDQRLAFARPSRRGGAERLHHRFIMIEKLYHDHDINRLVL